jgi:hypothetical protein
MPHYALDIWYDWLVTPLVSGELKITVEQGANGEPIDLFWHGRSLDRHPAQTIVPYVASILDHALKDKSRVRLHFETIEFMNSSTITAVIQIIREARNRQVALEIVFDRATEWQRLSFDALGVLMRGDDLLRIVGEPVRAK